MGTGSWQKFWGLQILSCCDILYSYGTLTVVLTGTIPFFRLDALIPRSAFCFKALFSDSDGPLPSNAAQNAALTVATKSGRPYAAESSQSPYELREVVLSY